MAITVNTVTAFPLDGSTREFNINFDYLARKFVQVALIGTGIRQELTIGQDYRFATATSIRTTVAQGSPYTQIEIRRVTSPTDRVVNFADGSILRASDLNASQVQAIHIAEEARDAAILSIAQDNFGNLDAKGRRIVNVAAGINGTDAVNKTQMDQIVGDAGGLLSEATEVYDKAKALIDNFVNDTANLKNVLWVYNAGSAAGGEIAFRVGTDKVPLAVPVIYINGVRQDVNYSYTYSTQNGTIRLAQALRQGDFVVCVTAEGGTALTDLLGSKDGWAQVSGSISPNSLNNLYVNSLDELFSGGFTQDVFFIKKDELAAIRDGTSNYDCSDDLQAAIDSGAKLIFLGNGRFKIGKSLRIPAGVKIVGAGSGLYYVIGRGLEEQNTGKLTVIETTFTGTNSIGIIQGRHSVIEDVCVRVSRYDLVDYQDASYGARAISEGRTDPATVNAQFGIHMYSGAFLSRVTVTGFAKDNIMLGVTGRATSCHSFMAGEYGYNTRGEAITDNASDGTMLDCVGMFCGQGGAWTRGNFWKIIGGRFEWNARYGVKSGGETVISGVTFDRNGWAGLYMNGGAWGQVVTGCYFCRNGVGGDGTTGRWKESVPGHYSYVDTPANMSCHIQIDFQHAATITGCRYRAGQSDALNGATGPAYIYSSASANGATPRNGLTISGNEGEYGSSVSGYYAAYPGASGYQVGGSDTGLINYLKFGMQIMRNGVLTKAVVALGGTTSQVTSIALQVPSRFCGLVYTNIGKSTSAAALSELVVTVSPSGGSRTIAKNVKATGGDSTGAGYIASMSYVAGTDGLSDTINLTLTEAAFVNYSVGFAGMA